MRRLLDTKPMTIVTLVVASVIVVAFQNCSFALAPDFDLGSAKLNGNGTGYDGKPYGSYGVCESGEVGLEGKIVVTDDARIFQVRKECHDLPEPLQIDPSALAVSMQSQDVFVFDTKVYDAIVSAGEESRVTRTICWSGDAVKMETAVFADQETYATDLTTQLKSYIMVDPNSVPSIITGVEETKQTDGTLSFAAARSSQNGAGDGEIDSYFLSITSTGEGSLTTSQVSKKIPGIERGVPKVCGCFVQPLPAAMLTLGGL